MENRGAGAAVQRPRRGLSGGGRRELDLEATTAPFAMSSAGMPWPCLGRLPGTPRLLDTVDGAQPPCASAAAGGGSAIIQRLFPCSYTSRCPLLVPSEPPRPQESPTGRCAHATELRAAPTCPQMAAASSPVYRAPPPSLLPPLPPVSLSLPPSLSLQDSLGRWPKPDPPAAMSQQPPGGSSPVPSGHELYELRLVAPLYSGPGGAGAALARSGTNSRPRCPPARTRRVDCFSFSDPGVCV